MLNIFNSKPEQEQVENIYSKCVLDKVIESMPKENHSGTKYLGHRLDFRALLRLGLSEGRYKSKVTITVDNNQKISSVKIYADWQGNKLVEEFEIENERARRLAVGIFNFESESFAQLYDDRSVQSTTLKVDLYDGLYDDETLLVDVKILKKPVLNGVKYELVFGLLPRFQKYTVEQLKEQLIQSAEQFWMNEFEGEWLTDGDKWVEIDVSLESGVEACRLVTEVSEKSQAIPLESFSFDKAAFVALRSIHKKLSLKAMKKESQTKDTME